MSRSSVQIRPAAPFGNPTESAPLQGLFLCPQAADPNEWMGACERIGKKASVEASIGFEEWSQYALIQKDIKDSENPLDCPHLIPTNYSTFADAPFQESRVCPARPHPPRD